MFPGFYHSYPPRARRMQAGFSLHASTAVQVSAPVPDPHLHHNNSTPVVAVTVAESSPLTSLTLTSTTLVPHPLPPLRHHSQPLPSTLQSRGKRGVSLVLTALEQYSWETVPYMRTFVSAPRRSCARPTPLVPKHIEQFTGQSSLKALQSVNSFAPLETVEQQQVDTCNHISEPQQILNSSPKQDAAQPSLSHAATPQSCAAPAASAPASVVCSLSESSSASRRLVSPALLSSLHRSTSLDMQHSREAARLVDKQQRKRGPRHNPLRLQRSRSLYAHAMSDRGAHHPGLNRLARIARLVRAERSAAGVEQSSLQSSDCINGTSHVIYAIYSLHSPRLYVGQTQYSAWHRFQKHVTESNTPSGSARAAAHSSSMQQHALHTDMLDGSHLASSFYTFPLECVPPEHWAKLKTKRQRTAFLLDREAWWMHRLHTFIPLGYNISGVAGNAESLRIKRGVSAANITKRRTRRAQRHRNPMRYRRMMRKGTVARKDVSSQSHACITSAVVHESTGADELPPALIVDKSHATAHISSELHTPPLPRTAITRTRAADYFHFSQPMPIVASSGSIPGVSMPSNSLPVAAIIVSSPLSVPHDGVMPMDTSSDSDDEHWLRRVRVKLEPGVSSPIPLPLPSAESDANAQPAVSLVAPVVGAVCPPPVQEPSMGETDGIGAVADAPLPITHSPTASTMDAAPAAPALFSPVAVRTRSRRPLTSNLASLCAQLPSRVQPTATVTSVHVPPSRTESIVSTVSAPRRVTRSTSAASASLAPPIAHMVPPRPPRVVTARRGRPIVAASSAMLTDALSEVTTEDPADSTSDRVNTSAVEITSHSSKDVPAQIMGQRLHTSTIVSRKRTRFGVSSRLVRSSPLKQYHIRWKGWRDRASWTWESASTFDTDPAYSDLRTDWHRRKEHGCDGHLDDPSWYYDFKLQLVLHEHSDLYVPEKIMDKHTGRDGHTEYFVLWRGYERGSWVPKANLPVIEYRELLTDYFMRKELGADMTDQSLYFDAQTNSIVRVADAQPAQPTRAVSVQRLADRAFGHRASSAPAFQLASPLTAAASAIVHASATAAAHGTRFYGSRHWLRRLRHVLHLLELGHESRIRWHLYAPRTLARMRQFLIFDASIEDISDAQRERLIQTLNTHFFARPALAVQRERVHRHVVRLEWTATQLRHANLRSVLLNNVHRLPWEVARDVGDGLLVAKRLIQPFGKVAFNYARVARTMTPGRTVTAEMTEQDDVYQKNKAQPCAACAQLPLTFRPQQGCVVTGDISLITDQSVRPFGVAPHSTARLRELCELGPKFRCFVRADPMHALRAALSEFVSRLSGDFKHAEAAFRDFEQHVLSECSANMAAGYQRAKDPILAPRLDLTRDAHRALRELQDRFVFVPIDKAANNMALICRSHYLRVLRIELQRADGAYRPASVSDDHHTVVLRHAEVLAPLYLMTQPSPMFRIDSKSAPQLPYLYWMPKLHKQPIGARFIAGSASCTTTQLSKLLSKALLRVSHTLRAKDDALLSATGIRRYFILDGYEQFTGFLRKWRRSLSPHAYRALASGDFSTLYTTLPHKDLVDKIGDVIREAWDWLEECRRKELNNESIQLRLVVSTPRSGKFTAEWEVQQRSSGRVPTEQRAHSAHEHSYTRETLQDAVRFLIDNIFSVNGGELLRQVLGIPMGTNCAPLLANLYLYWYESRFIDKMFALDASLAQAFHMTFRYIDDVLSADNPHWSHYSSLPWEDGGIYPRALVLNVTTLDGGRRVQYVGTTITSVQPTKQAFHIDVFNKRSEFPFAVRLYPHMSSLIPTSIPYGVFIGQLHRFAEICSTANGFLRQALSTAAILLERGCKQTRLVQCFKHFLTSRYAHPRSLQDAHKARFTNFNLFAAIKYFKIQLRARGAGERPSHAPQGWTTLKTTVPAGPGVTRSYTAASSLTKHSLLRSTVRHARGA
jgi:hypothetical protein